MAEISIYLRGNLISLPGKINIGIDDKLLIKSDTILNEYLIQTDLGYGVHKFWLELESIPHGSNKLFLEIENLKIDNCMMNHLLHDFGLTVINWNKEIKAASWFYKNYKEIPKEFAKSKHLDLRGTYYFTFEYPIEEWLRKTIKIHDDYSFMYNTPMQRFSNLKKLLGLI